MHTGHASSPVPPPHGALVVRPAAATSCRWSLQVVPRWRRGDLHHLLVLVALALLLCCVPLHRDTRDHEHAATTTPHPWRLRLWLGVAPRPCAFDWPAARPPFCLRGPRAIRRSAGGDVPPLFFHPHATQRTFHRTHLQHHHHTHQQRHAQPQQPRLGRRVWVAWKRRPF